MSFAGGLSGAADGFMVSGTLAAGAAAAPGEADGLAPGDAAGLAPGEAPGEAAGDAPGDAAVAGLAAGLAALAVVGAAAGALVGAAGAAVVQLTRSQMKINPARCGTRFMTAYRACAGCGVGAAYGFGLKPTSGRKACSIRSNALSRSRSHGSVPTIWLMTCGRLYRPISYPRAEMTCPLHQSDASLARNATAGATFSGARSSLSCGERRRSSGIDSVMRVAAPGAMAFDVTP